jgi:hypothetical protein
MRKLVSEDLCRRPRIRSLQPQTSRTVCTRATQSTTALPSTRKVTRSGRARGIGEKRAQPSSSSNRGGYAAPLGGSSVSTRRFKCQTSTRLRTRYWRACATALASSGASKSWRARICPALPSTNARYSTATLPIPLGGITERNSPYQDSQDPCCNLSTTIMGAFCHPCSGQRQRADWRGPICRPPKIRWAGQTGCERPPG